MKRGRFTDDNIFRLNGLITYMSKLYNLFVNVIRVPLRIKAFIFSDHRNNKTLGHSISGKHATQIITEEPKSSIEKKHIIIGIRYSILIDNRAIWAIGRRNSFDDYKNEVFEPSRLATREAMFKSICLPSLINMYNNKPDDISYKVVIMTSTLLPQKNKDFLEKIQSDNPFIEIIYHSPDNAVIGKIMKKSIDATVSNNEIYASVRLDDDDALSLAWLKKVDEYLIPEFNNMVISLSGGAALLCNKDGAIRSLASYKWRFGSVGLTYIGVKSEGSSKSIYQCGNHMTIDDRYQCIVYTKGNFILRAFSDFNDSGESFPHENVIKAEDHQAILKDFAIEIA